MSAARQSEPPPQLTTAARRDVAARELVSAIANFVHVVTEAGRDDSEWVDQATSPLGRRGHIRAVKAGSLKGVRRGRSYMVRRTDMDAYMASLPSGAREESGVDVSLSAALEKLGATLPGKVGR